MSEGIFGRTSQPRLGAGIRHQVYGTSITENTQSIGVRVWQRVTDSRAVRRIRRAVWKIASSQTTSFSTEKAKGVCQPIMGCI